MPLKIYNTLKRELETFTPLHPPVVQMYVCGMTVYDHCHLGHARSMIAFDVVQRWLKMCGWQVNYVRNVTDIDDKIIQRAQANGETIRALTNRMIEALHQDADRLGIERPTHEPRATDHVPHMIELIGQLEQRQLAYRATNGDINYSVRRFPEYGKLSGKSPDELRAGERVTVDTGKQDPLDFVLWKSAKADEPDEVKWPSPFGPGRPGWHIECSAMSCHLLGHTFDIHGGGADLQFPHHENEIAQSQGATGQPLARYWMHNGFITVDNEKMSKSLGNFFTIRDILKHYDAETIRFFIVRSHYRSSLNYSNVHLDDARAALKRLYTTLQTVPPVTTPIDWAQPQAARFRNAMNEDFGTPEAVAVLFELASETNRSADPRQAGLLRALGGVLGLLQTDPTQFLQGEPRVAHQDTISPSMRLGAITILDSPEGIEQKIAARTAAKQAKNFAEADRIRNDLQAQGILLKDSPQGTTWERQ